MLCQTCEEYTSAASEAPMLRCPLLWRYIVKAVATAPFQTTAAAKSPYDDEDHHEAVGETCAKVRNAKVAAMERAASAT